MVNLYFLATSRQLGLLAVAFSCAVVNGLVYPALAIIWSQTLQDLAGGPTNTTGDLNQVIWQMMVAGEGNMARLQGG